MIYRAALCDDDPAARALLKRLAGEWARERGYELELATYGSAEELLMNVDGADILLLDIEMRGMDGVSLAKAIRKRDENAQIVFVTGHSEYLAEGYEVSALHYLMKPVSREKLWATLDRAANRLEKDARALNLDLGGELVRVRLKDIRYLEVSKNYVTVHAGTEYTVKKPLSEFEGMLDEGFFRMGRAFIVRLNCVARVTKKEVYLVDGTALPLPRGQYEALNRAIIAHA